jgi:BTB/POZ domain-containing protein KCTD9
MLARFRLVVAFVVLCGCNDSSDRTQQPAAKKIGREVLEMPNARLSYEDSCRRLQKLGILAVGDIPRLPAAMPSFDDENLGVSFFRTLVGGDSLDNLTLPRTYIGRSEIRGTSLKNSDLSESRLCWNDFIEVDFTEAKLASSDLRASVYERVKFIRADLQNADLRRATFRDCDFTGASLRGAKLSKHAKVLDSLTAEQREEMDFQPEGDDPPGG